ncbi:MAG: hypothetical protein GY870_17930 [archaeon]|nr:hypothetical protein [archaeon]
MIGTKNKIQQVLGITLLLIFIISIIPVPSINAAGEQILSETVYTEEWIEDGIFNSPLGTYWTNIQLGDPSDSEGIIGDGIANYTIIGESYTFSAINGTPISYGSDPDIGWQEYIAPNSLTPYSSLHAGADYGIDSNGCWISHYWNEGTAQYNNTPSMEWKRNITMPVNMSQYKITSANISAIASGRVDDDEANGIEVLGDPTGGSHYDQGGILDSATFYVLISDIDENLPSVEIARYKTVYLGKDNASGEVDYLINQLLTQSLTEPVLISALASIFESNNFNFTITIGIDVYCEDNYSTTDEDDWQDLRIEEVNLNFTYEKLIEQSNSLSFNQTGNQINATKYGETGFTIDINNATLNFNYTVNQEWPSTSSNSEIKMIINGLTHTETVDLFESGTSWQGAKTGGFDVTHLIQQNVNITLELMVYIADEFWLDENLTVSIDNVSLIISYTVIQTTALADPDIPPYDFINDTIDFYPNALSLSVNEPSTGGSVRVANLGDIQHNYVSINKTGGTDQFYLEDDITISTGNSHSFGIINCTIYHDNSLFSIQLIGSSGIIAQMDWWNGSIGNEYNNENYTTYQTNQWLDVVIYFDLEENGWMFDIDGTTFGNYYALDFENSGELRKIRWTSSSIELENGYMGVDNISYDFTPMSTPTPTVPPYDFEEDIIGADPNGISLIVVEPEDCSANVENAGDIQQNYVSINKTSGTNLVYLEDDISYLGNTYPYGIINCTLYHDNSLFSIQLIGTGGIIAQLDLWNGTIGNEGFNSNFSAYQTNIWFDLAIYFDISWGWMFELDGTIYKNYYDLELTSSDPGELQAIRWTSSNIEEENGYLRVDNISYSFTDSASYTLSSQPYDFEDAPINAIPNAGTFKIVQPTGVDGTGSIKIADLGDVQLKHINISKIEGTSLVYFEDSVSSYLGNSFEYFQFSCMIYHDNSLYSIEFWDSTGTIITMDWWSGNIGNFRDGLIYSSYETNTWINLTIYFNVYSGWMYDLDSVRYGNGYALNFEVENPGELEKVRWTSSQLENQNGFMLIDDISYDFNADPILPPDFSIVIYVLLAAIGALVATFGAYQIYFKYPPMVRSIRSLNRMIKRGKKTKPMDVKSREVLIKKTVKNRENLLAYKTISESKAIKEGDKVRKVESIKAAKVAKKRKIEAESIEPIKEIQKDASGKPALVTGMDIEGKEIKPGKKPTVSSDTEKEIKKDGEKLKKEKKIDKKKKEEELKKKKLSEERAKKRKLDKELSDKKAKKMKEAQEKAKKMKAGKKKEAKVKMSKIKVPKKDKPVQPSADKEVLKELKEVVEKKTGKKGGKKKITKKQKKGGSK